MKHKGERKIPQEEDAMPWGDDLVTSKQWPRNEKKHFRIFGQNVNGISYYNKYIEWEMFLNYMDEFQADTICVNEVNLDLNKAEVKEELYK